MLNLKWARRLGSPCLPQQAALPIGPDSAGSEHSTRTCTMEVRNATGQIWLHQNMTIREKVQLQIQLEAWRRKRNKLEAGDTSS